MRRSFGYGEELQAEMERADAFTSIARGDDGEAGDGEADGGDGPDDDSDDDPNPLGGSTEGELVGESRR